MYPACARCSTNSSRRLSSIGARNLLIRARIAVARSTTSIHSASPSVTQVRPRASTSARTFSGVEPSSRATRAGVARRLIPPMLVAPQNWLSGSVVWDAGTTSPPLEADVGDVGLVFPTASGSCGSHIAGPRRTVDVLPGLVRTTGTPQITGRTDLAPAPGTVLRVPGESAHRAAPELRGPRGARKGLSRGAWFRYRTFHTKRIGLPGVPVKGPIPKLCSKSSAGAHLAFACGCRTRVQKRTWEPGAVMTAAFCSLQSPVSQ